MDKWIRQGCRKAERKDFFPTLEPDLGKTSGGSARRLLSASLSILANINYRSSRSWPNRANDLYELAKDVL